MKKNMRKWRCPATSSLRLAGLAVLVCLYAVHPALGQVGGTGASKAGVGIEPQLGQTIPLDLIFYDEDGEPVALSDVIQRPTALTLVYYRCPGICTPLLNALASTVDAVADKWEMTPGADYQLLTISFDPRERETPDLGRNKKAALLRSLENKVEDSDWRFLTGEQKNITALTQAVGFNYIPSNQDFTHAGTVIFLTQEGKIVSYLDGGPKLSPMKEARPRILPMEMKLAIIDATAGTPRTLMKKVQALCFSYDPSGKGYVLQVNRLILAVTVGFVLVFGSFLIMFKSKKKV